MVARGGVGGRGQGRVPQETPRPRKMPGVTRPAFRSARRRLGLRWGSERSGLRADRWAGALCGVGVAWPLPGVGQSLGVSLNVVQERGLHAGGLLSPHQVTSRSPAGSPFHRLYPPHRLLRCVTVIVSPTPCFLPLAHRSRATCPQIVRVASSASELSNLQPGSFRGSPVPHCHHSRQRLGHQPRSAV